MNGYQKLGLALMVASIIGYLFTLNWLTMSPAQTAESYLAPALSSPVNFANATKNFGAFLEKDALGWTGVLAEHWDATTISMFNGPQQVANPVVVLASLLGAGAILMFAPPTSFAILLPLALLLPWAPTAINLASGIGGDLNQVISSAGL